jgi:tRNA-2-methylthio-N6-dimethylallyladenosine synthase
MTYFFETYGCQMNQAESASVEQLLTARKWEKAENPDEADLVILNTCSVRITAETRVFGRIYHFCAQKRTRHVSVVVMGCMAERLKKELKVKYPKLDYVVGMFERQIFSDIFQAIEENRVYIKNGPEGSAVDGRAAGGMPADGVPADEKAVNAYFFAPSSYVKGAFQANVPIMNGCNNFCSYCIVPYVRGRELSRDMEEILDELDTLAGQGVREITLLGQNVNSYRYTEPATGLIIGFPELLTRIARRIEKSGRIRWVRFMSSHPKDLSDELIEVLSREKIFCRHLHLPVQHGSNRILAAMNRKYTREQYLSLVARIRARLPDATLTTDFLIGFPGETEEDLRETLDLISTVRYEAAFMYHYNPREGTKAFDLPDRIPEEIKKERLDRIITLQHSVSASLMKARIGLTVPVLIESTSRKNRDELFGHTELGEMVVFTEKYERSLIGCFVQAELTSLRGRTFRAKINENIPV